MLPREVIEQLHVFVPTPSGVARVKVRTVKGYVCGVVDMPIFFGKVDGAHRRIWLEEMFATEPEAWAELGLQTAQYRERLRPKMELRAWRLKFLPFMREETERQFAGVAAEWDLLTKRIDECATSSKKTTSRTLSRRTRSRDSGSTPTS